MQHVGNSQFQKVANSALVLDYLRRHRQVSRQEIAKAIGLRPSSVTYIINRLMQQGMVREVTEPARSATPTVTRNSSTNSTNATPSQKIQTPGSGRPPVLLELIADAGMVVGLDLQADYYCVVITDIRGDEALKYRDAYAPTCNSFEEKFRSTIAKVTAQATAPVLGVGLSIPGIVDTSRNLIKDAWTHELLNADLTELLKEFSFPITLHNDADCCAQQILWRESPFADGVVSTASTAPTESPVLNTPPASTESPVLNTPPASNEDSFLYLLTRFHNPALLAPGRPSVGIGMGLVFNGSLYRGFSSEAGEYQSILFANSNPPTWQVSLSSEEMDRAATDVAVQQKMVRELLGNMMLLLQVLNPRALYIGGDLAMHKDLIFQELNHYYAKQWQSLRAKGCSLVVVENGRFDPAWGAAAAMLEDLYSIPQIGEKSRVNSLVALAVQE